MSVLIRFLIYYDALSACAQSALKLDVYVIVVIPSRTLSLADPCSIAQIMLHDVRVKKD